MATTCQIAHSGKSSIKEATWSALGGSTMPRSRQGVGFNRTVDVNRGVEYLRNQCANFNPYTLIGIWAAAAAGAATLGESLKRSRSRILTFHITPQCLHPRVQSSSPSQREQIVLPPLARRLTSREATVCKTRDITRRSFDNTRSTSKLVMRRIIRPITNHEE